MTTKTYCPCWPVCTAADGATIAVGLLAEDHRDVDELAGPQRLVLVRERGLEQDGAGRGVDRVVHERQCAFRGRRRAAGDRGEHLIGSAVFLSTAGRYCAGNEKLAKMGRIWLIVTSGVVVRLDQVARLDVEVAGAALDRRA